MPSTVCGVPSSQDDGSDFFQSWQSETTKEENNHRHFPVIINHSSPKSIRKVLASNTVPKSASENGVPNPQMNCLCCAIEAVESRRLRNCLYATAFVPASFLFLLFVFVWLSELGLI